MMRPKPSEPRALLGVPTSAALAINSLESQAVPLDALTLPAPQPPQVPWARATFSTKERSHCAIVVTPPGSLPGVVAAGAGTRGGGRGGAAGAGGLEGSITFVAEPVAFYQLPSGALNLALNFALNLATPVLVGAVQSEGTHSKEEEGDQSLMALEKLPGWDLPAHQAVTVPARRLPQG